ncbi:hypothetical protein [Microbulbifer discodermiae]|uniref:hypothetical protein n=1 Tax=Microbulbifer sp. 2201CG32-9 TaxID=3232309 RepID=UPI00345BA59E
MEKISISKEYGIIIRKSALEKYEVTPTILFDVMETDESLGENEELISFGPHFGAEASDELSRRLGSLGLRYIDDFFVFYGDFPDWAKFYICEGPQTANNAVIE